MKWTVKRQSSIKEDEDDEGEGLLWKIYSALMGEAAFDKSRNPFQPFSLRIVSVTGPDNILQRRQQHPSHPQTCSRICLSYSREHVTPSVAITDNSSTSREYLHEL